MHTRQFLQQKNATQDVKIKCNNFVTNMPRDNQHYNAVEPLYSRHSWDRRMSLIERCPHFMRQNMHNPNVWDGASFPVRVSWFQGVLLRVVLLYSVNAYQKGVLLYIP